MVKIHQLAKFQAISAIRSPGNARKPQIWPISLSQNSAKIIKKTTDRGHKLISSEDGQDTSACKISGHSHQRTHVQVKRGYFRLRTDGRTDGQPENIMSPAPKGGGIKTNTKSEGTHSVDLSLETAILHQFIIALRLNLFHNQSRPTYCNNKPTWRKQGDKKTLENNISKVAWNSKNLKNKPKERDSNFLVMFSPSKTQRAIEKGKGMAYWCWSGFGIKSPIILKTSNKLMGFYQLIVNVL